MPDGLLVSFRGRARLERALSGRAGWAYFAATTVGDGGAVIA